MEETTTTYQKHDDDSQTEKKRLEGESSVKAEFDQSARKYLDWIDNIERILDDKSADQAQPNERREIIQVGLSIRNSSSLDRPIDRLQEVKTKYFSYDEQFQNLLQTGHLITRQLEEGTSREWISSQRCTCLLSAKQDVTEHQLLVQTLERRWQELDTQIQRYENDIEQSTNEEQFHSELEVLNKIRSEYETWIDAVPPSTSTADFQVERYLRKPSINSIILSITSSSEINRVRVFG